jgi:hypothetical protein
MKGKRQTCTHLCPAASWAAKHQMLHLDASVLETASSVRYDVVMTRTTLRLEDDALRAARAHARRHQLTLGQAVSDLVRTAIERPRITEDRSGLRVLRLSSRSPRVTTDLVDRLREDFP